MGLSRRSFALRLGRGLRVGALAIGAALGGVACNAAVGGGVVALVGGAGLLAGQCYDRVRVKVRDAESGRYTCEADVWVSDGESERRLRPCYNAALTEGKWRLTARQPGYTEASTELEIAETTGSCPHYTHSVELTLRPQGAPAQASRISPPPPAAAAAPSAPAAAAAPSGAPAAAAAPTAAGTPSSPAAPSSAAATSRGAPTRSFEPIAPPTVAEPASPAPAADAGAPPP